MTLFLTKNLDFRTTNSSLTPFFTQYVLCLIYNNSTSPNIGGTDAWAVSPPQILREPSPSSPCRGVHPPKLLMHIPFPLFPQKFPSNWLVLLNLRFLLPPILTMMHASCFTRTRRLCLGVALPGQEQWSYFQGWRLLPGVLYSSHRAPLLFIRPMQSRRTHRGDLRFASTDY